MGVHRLSRLENIISYAKDAYEVHRDAELVSVEAEILIEILKCKGKMRGGVLPTSTLTNEFNMDRDSNERWKSIQVGRVMSRLGFRPKRSSDGGRSGWLIDKALLSKLCKRYGIDEAHLQGKLI